MIKLIRYHLPTIVKHVLAPKNDFGIPKITWLIFKSFGNREDPPPPLGKIPKKSRFFLLGASLMMIMNPTSRAVPLPTVSSLDHHLDDQNDRSIVIIVIGDDAYLLS